MVDDVVAGGGGGVEGVVGVTVVVEGSVSETQSSRHSPCSCQSQSTTKSGTEGMGVRGKQERKEFNAR